MRDPCPTSPCSKEDHGSSWESFADPRIKSQPFHPIEISPGKREKEKSNERNENYVSELLPHAPYGTTFPSQWQQTNTSTGRLKLLNVLQGKAMAERTFPNFSLRAHCFPSTTSISKQIGTTPLVERQHFHPCKKRGRDRLHRVHPCKKRGRGRLHRKQWNQMEHTKCKGEESDLLKILGA